MTILSNIDYFKELPFYKEFIEKLYQKLNSKKH